MTRVPMEGIVTLHHITRQTIHLRSYGGHGQFLRK